VNRDERKDIQEVRLTKENEIIPPNLNRMEITRRRRLILLSLPIPYDQRPNERLGVEHVEMVHHLPLIDH